MRTSELVKLAKEEIVSMTGLELENIAAVKKDGDTWVLQADMLELKITPDTQDVLGVYEVVLDTDANVLNYRRIGRYHRAQLEIVYED
jgi:hypothetical protein